MSGPTKQYNNMDLGKSFNLPSGAKLKYADTIKTTFDKPDDRITDRVVLDVNGHEVQINHDHGSTSGNVLARVDEDIRVVHVSKLDKFISSRTSYPVKSIDDEAVG